jgi:hypothetical protein
MAAAIACFAIAGSGTGAAAQATGPPSTLFKKGYNLCRAAPLVAIRKVGGQHYSAGVFTRGVCNWERSDLRAGITLSTHPPSVGAALIRSFLTQNGKDGFKAERIRVAGASKAVRLTLPHSSSRPISKYLLAAYARGVIQINMTAPRSLPDTRLVAVMNLIARM